MNQRHNFKSLLRILLPLVAASLLLSAVPAFSADARSQGADNLQDTYRRNRAKLESNSFGLPLFLESFERGDRVHVDVYGIFNYPFSSVSGVLMIPANWCDIVALHPNVKACVYQEQPGTELLTFYIGTKLYQPPEDSRQVIYHYRSVARQKGYLDVSLVADEGPFGTENHIMRFEALPLAGGKTFVHVSYEYSDSVALRLAAKVYFATLGRNKVGFTETGTDGNGKPTYIGGPRGSIERNAVRYYFAIQSVMNSQRYAADSRFGISINEWYDLTSRYKKQLFDLEKKDYLSFKTSEHANQLTLQQRTP
jgi:hypothetical protein